MRLIFFCFCSALLIFPAFIVSALGPDIILSEVQIEGADSTDEFVELYNRGITSASLGGWKLCRRTSTGSYSQVKSFSLGDTVPSEGFYLFANGDGIFAPIADTTTKSSPLAANNSIALADSCSAAAPPTVILDSVAWGTGKPFDTMTPILGNPAANTSLVRDRKTLAWSLSDTPTPTDGKGGTLPKPGPNPPPDPVPDPTPTPGTPSSSVRLNELFPNPTDENDEWIELYNTGPDQATLDGWTLEDATKTKYVFPNGTTLDAGAYLVTKKSLSKISLNNTSETVMLLSAGGKTMDEVSYTSTTEDRSLNYSSGVWRWSKVRTPGAANILNNLPSRKRTEIPKAAYRDVYADFSAKGSDADGDSLKYVWDFGDGHKSSLRETRHRYTDTETYHGKLTIGDGTEATVKEFTVRVEKFPDRKIRIVAFSPNPKGNDTGTEWLLLKNKEKRKIDLLGWSIATGTKKKSIVNHPMNESFVLKPGEERALTNPIALFTLPNERGHIQLRKPDGTIAQSVQYRTDGSIAENAIYAKKDGGGWEWTVGKKQSARNREQGPENTVSADTSTENEADTEENQNPQSTISNLQSAIPPGSMSVIEERQKERRLAEIIRKESHIETPVGILSAPPHVLGTSVNAEPDTLTEVVFEKMNETVNGLVH